MSVDKYSNIEYTNIKLYDGVINMKEKTCETCVHYVRHYSLETWGCFKVSCGHCMYPMLKHRRPDTKACQHYELRPLPRALPDKAFVQRFLTTEFLQYILALDLPENTWWANTPEE